MSIGRTDLPGGDYATIIRSINSLLATQPDATRVLPDATRILPGHGPSTTVADERRANPYLR